MINTILIVLEVIVSLTILFILSKKYKTDGIYVYGIIATILSCIIGLKKISIMDISIPLGFGLTTSLIIGGNIITQKRGPEAIKTYLILILITFLISCCFINLSVFIEDSNYNYFANKSYNYIFTLNIKYYIGLIISLITSIWISSKLYYLLKRTQNKIILSNIFSIIIVEFIENIIFVTITYISEYKPIDIALCIVFRYTIKVIIGLFGTIPLYITNKSN